MIINYKHLLSIIDYKHHPKESGLIYETGKIISGEASNNICLACSEQSLKPTHHRTIKSLTTSHVTKFVAVIARLVAIHATAFFVEADWKQVSHEPC